MRPKESTTMRSYFLAILFALISSLLNGEETLDLSKPIDDSTPHYLKNADGGIITDVKPQDVIHWDVTSSTVDPQGTVTVGLRLRTEQEFTIYQNKLFFNPPAGYALDTIKNPKTTTFVDPIERKEVQVFTGGDFDVTFKSLAGSPPDEIELGIKYVGCTRVICLFPYTQVVRAKLFKSTTFAAPTATETVEQGKPEKQPDPKLNASFESRLASQLEAKNLSFGLILLIAFVGGLLTNLTPCVAPMIPITIRVLAKQSKRPFINSSMYSLGLMGTYTILGVIAAWSASLFGGFIAHPLVAGAFSIFMFLFGFSMIGFGNWSRLQQIGNKFGSGKESLVNTFFMGAGAGLVAAPCTGPVLASILTYTATSMGIAQSAFILAVYSAGFALPYVFLGQLAHRASQFRVRPHTQIATKMVFSSIMFGLGFYYLRLLLYPLLLAIKPHFLTISVVALGIGFAGIIAVIRAAHLHHKKFFLALPTVVFGLGLFAGSQFLTTATEHNLVWHFGEETALQAAKSQGKPLVIDAWAEWCEACKKMEITTFADPIVQAYLQKSWTLGKIDLTEQDAKSEALQNKYAIVGLPSLILLPANGDISKKEILAGFVDVATLMTKLQKFEQDHP